MQITLRFGILSLGLLVALFFISVVTPDHVEDSQKAGEQEFLSTFHVHPRLDHDYVQRAVSEGFAQRRLAACDASPSRVNHQQVLDSVLLADAVAKHWGFTVPEWVDFFKKYQSSHDATDFHAACK